MCYVNNSLNEEEAVQIGLLKWVESYDATWEVLIGAMKRGELECSTLTSSKKSFRKLCACACDYISSQCGLCWQLVFYCHVMKCVTSDRDVCHVFEVCGRALVCLPSYIDL